MSRHALHKFTHGRIRRMRWIMPFAAGAALATAAAIVAPTLSHAGSPATPSDRAKLRADLLSHRESAPWSGMARAALYGAKNRSPGRAEARTSQAALASGGTPQLGSANLTNVLVNDPGKDTHQTDQTTQSETSVAVAGSHVAVGFNDSQQALLAYTAGLDLSGVASSSDGGAHFTDRGTIANPENFTNIGDPWLTSDRAGALYYSTLTYGGDVGNLEIAVSKSTDGGATWSEPTFASPHQDNTLYEGDKDAIASGPSPSNHAKDVLYDTWDDVTCSFEDFTCTNGLPVAVSTDGGQTWQLHYADQIVTDPESCSFAQYIGAQPVVDPANGTLYVASEKLAVNDPHCTGGGSLQRSEVVFTSTDGGQTFSQSLAVPNVTAAFSNDAMVLGPGQFVRTLEFPSPGLFDGALYVSWNDGRSGHSHIYVVRSTDGGATWSNPRLVTELGNNDEIQPALTGDASGVHVAYYRRNGNNTLDTVVSDSTDGRNFTAKRVTSQSFPGVLTVPQFDPQIAFAYMGDYIAQVSVGGHQYFAWGDNRDIVTDFMFPQGRHDPDVFFAKR
ncbi:MAG: sialidase family protein [Actinomycetes bacterium]